MVDQGPNGQATSTAAEGCPRDPPEGSIDIAGAFEVGLEGLARYAKGEPANGRRSTSEAEMREFIDVAVDEAGGELLTILQASEPTSEANVDLMGLKVFNSSRASDVR
jgi:hypothetical protein